MRLVSITAVPAPRVAVVVDDAWLLDLAAASRALPSDIVELLRQGEPAMAAARTLLADAAATPVADRVAPAWRSRADTPLSAVVPRPGTLICVGLNYREHAREARLPIPQMPIMFAAFPGAVTGHGSEITWRAGTSEEVDYEAELGVVIGRTARNVSAADALDFVAGYCNANDVSARDIQRRDSQWTLAKSFDTFMPIGPELVTRDEVPDPHVLRIRCAVNGETLQDSNTSELIFGVPQLIAHVSAVATLHPGDVMVTGTPSGVGMGRTPRRWLVDGDVVEVSVEGLGTLRNTVHVVPA